MLEPPNLADEKIVACLQDEYGLSGSSIEFLPLGADLNTAVYRVETADRTYFLKLRSGDFDEASVALPKFLHEQGIEQIIPPLPTRSGALWASLDHFKTILCPFVDGRNGYETQLTDPQWHDFGATLKQIHTAPIPASIRNSIKPEAFSLQWCKIVKECSTILHHSFVDPIASELAAFLQPKSAELFNLVARTEALAQILRNEPQPNIVCHADLHAGNLLLDNASGALYIVDWDTLVIAPKEHDLMYIGGALLASGKPADEEETLFYDSYGDAEINPLALAYYRYARIVEDIAIYCQGLLFSDKGGQDRLASLRALKSNFEPDGTIARAVAAEPS